MCLYCMIADHHFKFDPPWRNDDLPSLPIHPQVPRPIYPFGTPPWPLERLKEFEDLLRRVHELEEKLGCPCEPNKADYLTLFRERIEKLEAEAAKRPGGHP